ncbi:hypothetical protein DdX_15715 [Ditylenchus destructor]|uniref:Uncharacterized protein n=1 Tax=Ditylenchus destructor TaxID=166010 RepID=A0AAD4MRP5_9BILA|nr:hypothetical protein DdX_15715 [Ditylenchus destructor]
MADVYKRLSFVLISILGLGTVIALFVFLPSQQVHGAESDPNNSTSHDKINGRAVITRKEPGLVYNYWTIRPENDPKHARILLDRICQVPQDGDSGYHPENVEGLDEEAKQSILEENSMYESMQDVYGLLVHKLSVSVEGEGNGTVFLEERKKKLEFAKNIIRSYYRLDIYRRSLEAIVESQVKDEEGKRAHLGGVVSEIKDRLSAIASAFPGDMGDVKDSENYIVLVLGTNNTLPPGHWKEWEELQ